MNRKPYGIESRMVNRKSVTISGKTIATHCSKQVKKTLGCLKSSCNYLENVCRKKPLNNQEAEVVEHL